MKTNYKTRLKSIEELLYWFISHKTSEHENRTGIKVNCYLILNNDYLTSLNGMLKKNGYIGLTSDFYWFNVLTLSSVSYCEGDVYILLYDNVEQYESELQRTKEFIING